jgi:hypothetical protein
MSRAVLTDVAGADKAVGNPNYSSILHRDALPSRWFFAGDGQ